MPNCFSLTRKGESEPTDLVKVDEELCKHLGVECDPKHWTSYWYGSIGFHIACGKPLGSKELRDVVEYIAGDDTPNLLKCLNYLEEHFTSDAWVEIGRRRADEGT